MVYAPDRGIRRRAGHVAKKRLIKYSYVERPSGGVVVITTADAAALKAIHEFMRYQITEHKTGDPLTLK